MTKSTVILLSAFINSIYDRLSAISNHNLADMHYNTKSCAIVDITRAIILLIVAVVEKMDHEGATCAL